MAIHGDDNGDKMPSDQKDAVSGKDTDALGDALRTVYDDAASEDIPADMLDLLGKLS